MFTGLIVGYEGVLDDPWPITAQEADEVLVSKIPEA
jgi:hypothetical protein